MSEQDRPGGDHNAATGVATGEINTRSVRPGPVYDAAMRGLVEHELAAVCARLDVPTTGTRVRVLSATFPTPPSPPTSCYGPGRAGWCIWNMSAMHGPAILARC
jgi:hypothetical protein